MLHRRKVSANDRYRDGWFSIIARASGHPLVRGLGLGE
jgi:hypothetical protein